MSKFYMPLCSESFLLSTVIIMSNKSVHHTGNYLANEKKTKIYKQKQFVLSGALGRNFLTSAFLREYVCFLLIFKFTRIFTFA
jgi:hypothetical protein